MKILVLPSWYPPQGGGFFRDYCEAFQKRGNTVYVIAIEICSLKKIKVTDVIQSLHIKVCNENGVIVLRTKYLKLPKFEKINALLWSMKMTKLCRFFFKNYEKPDFIHVHSAIWAGLTGAYVSEKYQVPLILTEHRSRFIYNNPFAAKLLNEWQTKLLKKVYTGNVNVIAVSCSIKQTISSDYNLVREIDVIGNIVDYHYFKPADNRSDTRFTLLSITNLEFYKGVDILLEAFSKFIPKCPSANLVIGGSGSMFKALEKKCSDLAIKDNVVFLGQLSKEEVRKQMQSANAFVSSSRFEAFGVAIIEAMACGIPVIATTSGGPQDIIINENLGILVEINNSDTLAQAMEKMYHSHLTYDKNYIRNYAISNYSADVITEKYMKVAQNILSAKLP